MLVRYRAVFHSKCQRAPRRVDDGAGREFYFEADTRGRGRRVPSRER